MHRLNGGGSRPGNCPAGILQPWASGPWRRWTERNPCTAHVTRHFIVCRVVSEPGNYDLIYTYKPPVSVGISVSPSGPRAADRISRLTGARHARGHDPAPRIARRLASGGRRTAPVACAHSANIHDLHLCNALVMRAANVRAALARGATPAHACRSPLSNAGAWREHLFRRTMVTVSCS